MLNKLGLITYYGLNFLSDICELQDEMIPYTKRSYERFFTIKTIYELKSSLTWYLNWKEYNDNQIGFPLVSKKENKGYEFFNGKGIIEGVFWGGCLESIFDIYTSERYNDQRSVYEKYNLIPSPDFFKDKILFLETSEEKPKPEKFAKMIDLLIKEQILINIKCLLVCKPDDEIYYDEYKEILTKKTKELNLPFVYNLNFGQELPRNFIPYGIKGEVDFKQRKIFINENIFKN